MRHAKLLAVVVLPFTLTSVEEAALGFELSVDDGTLAQCSSTGDVFIRITNEDLVQAFSFGIAHNPEVASLTAMGYSDCPVLAGLNEGTGPSYFNFDLQAGTANCDGGISAGGTVYCITSISDPVAQTIPVGTDQPILRLSYELVPGAAAGSSSPLDIVGCLGTGRPWSVVLTVGGETVSPQVIGGQLVVGSSECPFIRGDVNDDGNLDISDIVTILLYLFNGSGPLKCASSADTTDDEKLDIADAIRELGYLFLTGTPLPLPFPGCGKDPTPDSLECVESACN